MRKNLLLLTLLAYLMCSPILAGEEEKPAKEQKKGEQSKVGRNRTEERPQTKRIREILKKFIIHLYHTAQVNASSYIPGVYY